MTPGLEDSLAKLRQWQSRRLSQTYGDFLASKEYAAACGFILSDLYAATDFSQRDHDFERLHDILAHFLPAHMLRVLRGAITLNQLTNDLDRRLLRALVEETGGADALTPAQYALGYRICDNYEERLTQIELLAALLNEVITSAHFPLTGISLRLAYAPAKTAGWMELYDFLARGYAAAQPVHNIDKFVSAIHDREMEILKRIFAGSDDPFENPVSARMI